MLQSAIAAPALIHRAVDETELIPFRNQLLFEGVRPVVAYGALNSTARGITLGREVYLRQDVFDSAGAIPAFLLVHEVAHVVQFLRDGTPYFLSRYLGEYFRGLLRFQSGHTAYLAISYEVEARMVETFLPAELQR